MTRIMKLLPALTLLMSGVLCGSASADLIVTQGALGVQRYTNDGVSLGTLIAPGTGGLTDARGVAGGAGGGEVWEGGCEAGGRSRGVEDSCVAGGMAAGVE